jgi:hypothetical protein
MCCFWGGLRHAHFYLVISLLLGVNSISLLNRLLSSADFQRQCFLRFLSVRSGAKGRSHVQTSALDTQSFSAKSKRGASWLARFRFEPGFFASRFNGLAVVLCVRFFLARAREQPSLMFAFGGGDEALDPDTCFAVGREHVPKLRSVRTASVFDIDALRHAANCMSPRRRGAHGERYDTWPQNVRARVERTGMGVGAGAGSEQARGDKHGLTLSR